MPTRLDPELLRAYRETEYRVTGPPGFVLRIGASSEALRALHRRHGVRGSAFVTACNPYSAPLSAAQNAERQARLVEEVRRAGHVALDGIGQHSNNDWSGEPSVLVLGVRLAAARALGVRFEQNAIVWAGRDAVPRLVLLR